jgi:hypothetical protein
MPIWVNESKDGFEYVCMCDRCGVEGPPSPTDDEAVEGFHAVREEGKDTLYHCPFCHVLLEEGPIPEDVAISRIAAVLQQQGSQLSFIPGTRARELVDQLVQGLYGHTAEAFTRNPLVELPPWAETGALVRRGDSVFRIKQVTPSEVVLSNGSQLVVWSRSQQPMDQEFEPTVPFTRTDFLLEVEEE